MKSNSVSPAIVNIHIPSQPLASEKKKVMLKEIEVLLSAHAMKVGSQERSSNS